MTERTDAELDTLINGAVAQAVKEVMENPKLVPKLSTMNPNQLELIRACITAGAVAGVTAGLDLGAKVLLESMPE